MKRHFLTGLLVCLPLLSACQASLLQATLPVAPAVRTQSQPRLRTMAEDGIPEAIKLARAWDPDATFHWFYAEDLDSNTGLPDGVTYVFNSAARRETLAIKWKQNQFNQEVFSPMMRLGGIIELDEVKVNSQQAVDLAYKNGLKREADGRVDVDLENFKYYCKVEKPGLTWLVSTIRSVIDKREIYMIDAITGQVRLCGTQGVQPLPRQSVNGFAWRDLNLGENRRPTSR